jgi:diguanylate cyclase (GGDEF)-like protein
MSGLRRLVTLPRVALAVMMTLVLASWGTLVPAAHGLVTGTSYGLLQDSVYLLGALIVAGRAVHAKGHRLPWVLLSVGLASYGLGNVLYYAVIQDLHPEPFPSLADALWLPLYPLLYGSSLLQVRDQLREWHASQWLDGLIAACGAGALVVTFALEPVMAVTSGSMSVVVVNLAYPAADLLLLMLIFLVFAVSGGRPGSRWWLMGVGMATFAFADGAYLLQVSAGTFQPGTWVDQVWLVGVVAMAMAAWTRHTQVLTHSLTGLRLIAIPMLFSVGSLGLLVRDGLDAAHHLAIATVLAGATIAAALVRTALTFREVRQLADAQQQARTDDLTGLANRRQLLERLEQALTGDARSSSGAVLLLDLDRFKEVNDSFGHHVGDDLLRLLAVRLADAIPTTGLLARMGGDEFGVVLPGADDGEAIAISQRIRVLLQEPFVVEGLLLHTEGSIGIATFSENDADAATLLRQADIAMYEAKAHRSGHAVFDEQTHGGTRTRMETLTQFRAALDGEDLVLHYQPKVDLETDQVVGVEALVRWQHPTRGLVLPDSFLPLAEQAGLMARVTDQVLVRALRDLRSFRQTAPTLTMSVNVSASNLLDLGLPARVFSSLVEADLPPGALTLEITENILIEDPVRVRRVLAELRTIGVTLSVDDYGTGFCSLGYLRELPVQELKLDRTFVTGLLADPRSGAIVRNTISLARELGMTMVAEGVEDASVLAALREWGCDLAQGYHVSRPLTRGDLIAWLAAQDAGAHQVGTALALGA